MVSGLILSFVLPKIISVEAYGYWHLFLLYAGYVGLLHLGYGDGLYLKLGGQYFSEFDRKKWYPQIQIIALFQILFAWIVAVYAFKFNSGNPTRLSVFAFLAAYILIDNIYKLLSFILMATDKVAYYSRTVIIDKVFMLLSIACLFFFADTIEVSYIIGAYVLSHIFILILVMRNFPSLFTSNFNFSFDTFKSVYAIAISGIILTLSNILSTLITGSCKMIVEKYWDITVFAQLSFALVVSSFLLIFISQISYVLFPFLRRIPEEKQGAVLSLATSVLTSICIILFCGIFPIYIFVYYWLPEYKESLHFFTILAPVCFYDLKTCLLFNTYFKNLSRIKELLMVNVVVIITAVVIYVLAVRIHNMELMAFGILISLVLKASIMQLWLFRYYKQSIGSLFFFDLAFSACMVLVFYKFGIVYTCVCYLTLVCVFIILYRNMLRGNFNMVKQLFNNK